MPTERGVLREVAWTEVAPWLMLFRAVKLAFDPRKLVLAAAGIVLTWGGWWVCASMFSGSQRPDVKRQVDYYRTWMEPDVDVMAQVSVGSSDARRAGTETAWWYVRTGLGALADVPWRLSRPFRDLFRQDASLTGLAMSTVCALWALAVWGFIGGAITRIAALQLAQEQRYSMVSAVRYAVRKWPSYFAAPLFPFAFSIVGLAPLAFAGLLSRPDAGFVVSALAWPLLLVLSLLLVILMVGLLLGWPLMFAATSVEGQDAFDAFNRLHAYVYQRFFQLVFYAGVALMLGVFGWLVARYLAELVLYLAAWGASFGAGPRSEELFQLSQLGNGALPSSKGGSVLAFWASLVQLLVMGYGYAYFWTAITAVYLLVRRDCDGVSLETVFQETAVAQKPLPRLVRDEAGVPVLSPEEREELTRPNESARGAGSEPSAHEAE